MTTAHRAHPQPNYLAVFGWLTALTLVEVGISYAQQVIFPTFQTAGVSAPVLTAGVIASLVVIASAKASLVALYFMHLKYDSRWYAVVLMVALFFALLFSWALFRF